MNRSELQLLAENRVRESQALLSSGEWSGAYYLIGYAVECGLKSCVLAHIETTGALFRDKKYSEKCWTHDLEELVKLCGLDAIRTSASGSNNLFGTNWLIVKDWNESARYHQWTEPKARRLFLAVTEQTNGVLPWIKNHW